MELRNIETFIKLTELENFSRTAEYLNYSQSTVTIQIQQLEKELGFQLFERIGKKVILTNLGKQFLSEAKEMKKIEEQMLHLGMNKDEVSGTLRVGSIESLINPYSAKLITEYHRQFPKVKLDIRTSHTTELLQMIKQNSLDVAVGFGRKIADRDCCIAYARPYRLSFVAHPDNKLAGQRKIRLEEVLAQPLLLTERDSIYRQELEEMAANEDAVISPSIEIDNTMTLMELVQRGLGVSFLPNYIFQESISGKKLSILNVRGCNRKFWCQIFHHRNKWVSPAMRAFINLTTESFQENFSK
ncbi:MAG: LysR family transcriptional regulator [Sphaerochaetaceae bacterium]|nr:LysR family transcriptional regulator [Sphaerochaetaceae bacterium]